MPVALVPNCNGTCIGSNVGHKVALLAWAPDDAACISYKGTGDFEWCRQTMDELSVFGTSRTSNELKSGP